MSVKHFFSTVQADKGGDSNSQGHPTYTAKKFGQFDMMKQNNDKENIGIEGVTELSPNQIREKYNVSKEPTQDFNSSVQEKKIDSQEEFTPESDIDHDTGQDRDKSTRQATDNKTERASNETTDQHTDQATNQDYSVSNTDAYDLELQNSRLKDEILRMHADMENTKKRLNRLFEDRVKDKTISLLLDVISHIDNFERAFEAQEQMKEKSKEKQLTMKEFDAVSDGFRIIKTQLLSNLKNNWGLNAIEPLNKEFDPNFHEALLQEESKTVQYPTVIQELLRGYMYYDKVIRPSKVKVVLPTKEND